MVLNRATHHIFGDIYGLNSLQISSNSALESLKFFFHKCSTGATASIISTHHLSVWQFLNQYCLFFLVFLCCIENSCFLIRFSLETKILIIFLSMFYMRIYNVKSLVDNCREVVNKTIICRCKHCSCLLHASAIFSISPCWHRAEPFQHFPYKTKLVPGCKQASVEPTCII